MAGNGLDRRVQLLLDLEEIEAIRVGDEVNGKTKVTEATRSTNTMEVSFGVLGEIEVDNDVDGRDIDTASKKVRRNKVTASAVAEVMENAVSVVLGHLGVDEEARISHLGDLLGKKFHAGDGVTKDNRLVNIEFGKQGMKAMKFLTFFDKGIVLRDTLKSEVVHNVDIERRGEVFVFERFHGHRESGREEENLSVIGEELNDFLNENLEFGGKKFVGFVHNQHVTFAQITDLLLCEIQNTTGGSNQKVDGLIQTNDIILQISTTSGHHHRELTVLSELLTDLRGLEGELASRDENQHLKFFLGPVGLVQRRDNESSSLSSSVLSTSEDILSTEGNRDGFLLDGGWGLVTLLENTHQKLTLQIKIFKFFDLGLSNIFSLNAVILVGGIEVLLPFASVRLHSLQNLFLFSGNRGLGGLRLLMGTLGIGHLLVVVVRVVRMVMAVVLVVGALLAVVVALLVATVVITTVVVVGPSWTWVGHGLAGNSAPPLKRNIRGGSRGAGTRTRRRSAHHGDNQKKQRGGKARGKTQKKKTNRQEKKHDWGKKKEGGEKKKKRKSNRFREQAKKRRTRQRGDANSGL